MNRFIYILVIIVFGTTLSKAQQVYYPLEIGNKWEYWFYDGPVDSGAYGQTDSITKDTLMPNGKYYADNIFQRQEGDSVFQYQPYSQTEYLLYDFTRSVGDTVNSFLNGQDTTDIILVEKSTDVIFGKSRKKYRFYIDHYRHSFDDEQFVNIMDSIGVTERSFSLGEALILKGVVINGISYGIISSAVQFQHFYPSGFSLNQNYPNPFNPATSISYSLTKQSPVTIQVFDVLGNQREQLLFNTIQESGLHNVQFDGTTYPSGVYFYRLTAGTYIQTKKMILQK